MPKERRWKDGKVALGKLGRKEAEEPAGNVQREEKDKGDTVR